MVPKKIIDEVGALPDNFSFITKSLIGASKLKERVTRCIINRNH